MKSYRLLSVGFRDVISKNLLSRIPLLVLALTASILIGFKRNLPEDPILIAAITIPILILASGMGLYIGVKREREGWMSYQLIIENDKIIRKQTHRLDIEIAFNQIKSIQENISKGITIRTEVRQNMIFIPKSLDGYQEVKDFLIKLKSFDSPKNDPANNAILTYIGSIAMIAAFGANILSTNKYIIISTGTIVTLALIFGLIYIQKSHHIDSRVKKSSWVVLFALFCVIMRMLLLINR